jgi:hypothetical protein
LSGRDAVYAFDLPATLTIDAQVTTSAFSPVLYLLKGNCSQLMTQAGCVAGSQLIVSSQPAGRYYLVVDSSSGAGPYSLSVTLK